jgi:hypothetical protein
MIDVATAFYDDAGSGFWAGHDVALGTAFGGLRALQEKTITARRRIPCLWIGFGWRTLSASNVVDVIAVLVVFIVHNIVQLSRESFACSLIDRKREGRFKTT